MFKAIGAFLAPYKLFIYVGLASCIVGAWVWDRHAQYNKGVAACELEQAEAKANYWEQRSTRLAEEGKIALEKEKVVGSRVSTLDAVRKREVEREAAKPIADSCLYSDAELRELEELIRETGEGSSVVPANSNGSVQ